MFNFVHLLFTRVARALSFDIRVPNKLTQRTLEASDRNEDVVEYANKEELFKKLGIG